MAVNLINCVDVCCWRIFGARNWKLKRLTRQKRRNNWSRRIKVTVPFSLLITFYNEKYGGNCNVKRYNGTTKIRLWLAMMQWWRFIGIIAEIASVFGNDTLTFPSPYILDMEKTLPFHLRVREFFEVPQIYRNTLHLRLTRLCPFQLFLQLTRSQPGNSRLYIAPKPNWSSTLFSANRKSNEDIWQHNYNWHQMERKKKTYKKLNASTHRVPNLADARCFKLH